MSVADTILDIDIDALIDEPMRIAVEALDGDAPLLLGMACYHLGWVDHGFSPLPSGATDRGKRIRPLVALLSCAAAGGDARRAAPLAAAVELLHNFTLVHDDIQDHSPTRRHRPTVWTLWGTAQAINAGDALFAAAHLALFRSPEEGVSLELVLDLATAFQRMTLAIVGGQVLDLSFEGRHDVDPDAYLTMIAGKTAAIVRYAAWAGALLGGADLASAERFGEFGLALGFGFQIQDDLLGVWGTSAATGKAAADDIRRKKQSLPILLLRAHATPAELDELNRRYAAPEIDGDGVAAVLAMLDRHHIRRDVERQVREYHDRALNALDLATPDPGHPARAALAALVETLASRSG